MSILLVCSLFPALSPGMTFDDANDMMTHDPEGFQSAVQSSLRRHLAAVQSLRLSDGLLFFDYGNAFLLECHRAGCEVDPQIPSYVGACGVSLSVSLSLSLSYLTSTECIMGPEFFDFGFGPYR